MNMWSENIVNLTFKMILIYDTVLEMQEKDNNYEINLDNYFYKSIVENLCCELSSS